MTTESKGFSTERLQPGTRITVETKHSVYLITIVEGKAVKISGGMLKNGELRFPEPTEAILVGSTWGSNMIKLDWIGEGMYLELMMENKRFLTSNVCNAEIESPDGNWSYSMGWNKS